MEHYVNEISAVAIWQSGLWCQLEPLKSGRQNARSIMGCPDATDSHSDTYRLLDWDLTLHFLTKDYWPKPREHLLGKLVVVCFRPNPPLKLDAGWTIPAAFSATPTDLGVEYRDGAGLAYDVGCAQEGRFLLAVKYSAPDSELLAAGVDPSCL